MLPFFSNRKCTAAKNIIEYRLSESVQLADRQSLLKSVFHHFFCDQSKWGFAKYITAILWLRE